eukprot:CAMPEP_0203636586 /NCGR_PEP_ID=MMETSP0088-20131115/3112_1 /ASSEMBLY_ACC=CAM_ASM_001087 /TAXON_ID=426623 /ORGANISM="Chaetoceros affinis, Strain CCMP159" /LENGTH=111 /DNA_ID=CAMNT_0050490775 /DNA_START=768 /DNA_END=1106 /DNA_ORIENTATION=+
MSSLIPFLAGTFASKSYSQLSQLHDTVMDILDNTTSNICLQHRLLTASSNAHNMAAKIDQFESMEYHDEFADWLLQSKLEESGFILSPYSKTNSEDFLCTVPVTYEYEKVD